MCGNELYVFSNNAVLLRHRKWALVLHRVRLAVPCTSGPNNSLPSRAIIAAEVIRVCLAHRPANDHKMRDSR